MFSKAKSVFVKAQQNFPKNDVVVIGGGVMGASCAYWLKEKQPSLNITVIEKDPTYLKCTTTLSVGGIRQQFSTPENVQLSLFGAEFIKNLKKRFGPTADLNYRPNGYLILANSKGAQQLEFDHQMQQKLGVENCLLSKRELQIRFPWLNVNGIELGCLGGQTEGWFDPWSLLSLFKQTAVKKGVSFLHGQLVGFLFGPNGQIQAAEIQMSDGALQRIFFEKCVVAGGAESGKISALAKIQLPVERRKRFVYSFGCKSGIARPGEGAPLTCDPSGAYFRKEGQGFIGGASPLQEDEPATEDLEVDFGFFEKFVWPLLANRIPAFESIKVKSAWSGFYEYNTLDQNGIIGPHNIHENVLFATGFSGHGIQQAPAVGLAIAELILNGHFKTIDLSRLGFARVTKNEPIKEIGVY